MTAIITATELAAELTGERPPVLLDVRWQLTVAKAAGAAARARPGAVGGRAPPPPGCGAPDRAGGARPPRDVQPGAAVQPGDAVGHE
ncbi:sulfurtransferase, partial [Streptomyces diastatochromogenes]